MYQSLLELISFIHLHCHWGGRESLDAGGPQPPEKLVYWRASGGTVTPKKWNESPHTDA
jgi:hypothetical protein